MSATEKPVTELTPKTSTSALSGNAVVIYNKTTGDADSLDGDSLKTLLDDADTAYQLPQTGIPRTDLSQDIKDELDGKASRDTDAVEGDLAEFDANGNPVDSGIATSSVMLKDVSAGEGDLAVFNDEGGVTPGFNVDEVMRKTVGTVEGNLAEFNADGNPVDSGVPTSKIGEIDEKVTVLRNSAGIAEGIADTISAGTPQEFVFRQSGGDGVNYMKRIKGKTLAWNQLLEDGDFPTGTTAWSFYAGTGSISNGEATLTIGAAITSAQIFKNQTIPQGHKIYQSVEAKASTSGVIINRIGNNHLEFNVNSSSFVRSTRILTISSGGTNNAEATIQNKSLPEGASFTIRNFMRIDLTILGIDDLTTVAEVEAWLANNIGFRPYYPYTPGKLISNDASEIETVGFNQWDEEWLAGYYQQDGTYISANNRICSKNWVPVFPNTTYFLKSPVALTFFFYDADKNFIEGSAVNITANTEFTTPANARWCLWYCTYTDYGNVYNHDICINLSDASFDGQYEPYWKRTLILNLNNIKVKSHNIWDEEWEEGAISSLDGQNITQSSRIRSKNYIKCISGANYYFHAGSSYFGLRFYDADKNFIPGVIDDIQNAAFTTPTNAAYVRFCATTNAYGPTYNNDICINVSSSFNGQYEPHGILTFNGVPSAGSVYDEIVGNKYVKRVGSVDLGNLSWTMYGSDDTTRFQAVVSDKKYGYYNIICRKYVTVTPNTSSGASVPAGYISGGGSNNQLYVKNSEGYADAAAFKTAMSGVMLNYELATPIEYELVDHLPFAILVDKSGTEQAIYPEHEDGSPSAPFCCDSNYSISVKNLVAIINSLNTE